MLCSCQSGISTKLISLVPAIWVASTCVFLLSEPCNAADSPLPDTKLLQWVKGPTNIPLASVAQMKVPQGFAFLDAENAHAFLAREKELIPKGLLGLMVSPQDVRLIVAFDEVGYVKATETRVDSVQLLAKWRSEQQKGLGSHSDKMSADWSTQPARKTDDTWEYAISVQRDSADGTSEEFAQYTIQRFGSKGLLTLTFKQKGFFNQDAVQTLASYVTFRPGQAYSDYKEGLVYTNSLASLLAGEGRWVTASEAGDASSKAMTGLIARYAVISVGVAAAFVGIAMAFKKLRRRRPLVSAPEHREPVQVNVHQAGGGMVLEVSASGPAGPAADSAGSVLPVPARNGFRPKLTPTPLPPQTETKEKHRRTMKPVVARNGAHLKREFDYNRYFADLMSTVSSHGLTLEQARTETTAQIPAFIPPAGNGNGIYPAPTNGNADLIANQTAFIEEQRRLIQEQTRLIEEKSRLIAEKNQLLKLQSELIEHKVL
jgi:uncharacterized membrane-anchored protein